jgi:hypothetical protein
MPKNKGPLRKWRPSCGAGTLRGCATLTLIAATLAGCGMTRHSSPGDASNPAAAGASSGVGGSAATAGGSNSAGPPTPGLNLEGAPKYYRFVRLTNSQWANSVQEVLQLAAPSGLEQAFAAPASGVTDFSNNELLLDVNARDWADFQAAAEALAEQVTASDDALAAVYPGTDAAGFIKTVGRRAYRRPLTAAEVSTYTTLFTSGTAMSGDKSTFAKGAALVIRALLQSPNFLYRTELGPTGKPLSGYEAAAKISLWLRNSTPDAALLDAAETLSSADALAKTATSMLSEDAATAVMRQFHGEFLHLDRFKQLSKVGVPSYDESLNAEYEESSYLFFDNIFKKDLGLRDILMSTRGFVGPGMAPLYGLKARGSGFVEQELGAVRVGYFSQLPFLTLNAHNGDPDTIHRGIALALDVLCATLGQPAIDFPPLPSPQPGQTNRMRVEATTNGCGTACHTMIIDPLGFAFEHFDGMGQYRDTEVSGVDNLPIDSSGVYTFTEGAVAFADNTELMQAMASTTDAHLCYSKKLASFGLQRDIVTSDLPWLTELAAMSRDDAGSLQKLIIELIKSNAFRTHGGAP